jgi:endonuclease/exonuclease/phosphatase family metal-dependent hydrolase
MVAEIRCGAGSTARARWRQGIRLAWVFLCLLLSPPAVAEELKIATWNLDWLTNRPGSERFLPPDVIPRQDADFARLATYVRQLDADVVAIEEVDGPRSAAPLFPSELYSVHMTNDRVMQRVGIAVRRGIHYDINPDLTALAEAHLRSGADITLHIGTHDLRVLAVHLKKGCRNVPLSRAESQACVELRDQIGPLKQWILDRTDAGEAFVILGDFNRWMDGKDTFLKALRHAAPLVRATEGRSSPCWGGENFIDHILAGGQAAQWMQADTLKVLVYQETDPALKDRLSDHCPVSVRFDVPP